MKKDKSQKIFERKKVQHSFSLINGLSGYRKFVLLYNKWRITICFPPERAGKFKSAFVHSNDNTLYHELEFLLQYKIGVFGENHGGKCLKSELFIPITLNDRKKLRLTMQVLTKSRRRVQWSFRNPILILLKNLPTETFAAL